MRDPGSMDLVSAVVKISTCARLGKIDRGHLGKLLARYGIDKP